MFVCGTLIDVITGAEDHSYGGFLLRAMEPLTATGKVSSGGKQLIEGPCRLVDHILAYVELGVSSAFSLFFVYFLYFFSYFLLLFVSLF